MNWKDYLKQQGLGDAQIVEMEKTFGADTCVKMFAQPMQQLADANSRAQEAIRAKDEFDKFYKDEVVPNLSKVYQDAINQRTRATALEARLKAAKEYGFLTDGVDDLTGTSAGTQPSIVPGVPAVPGSPAVTPGTAAALDPAQFVSASVFTKAVNDIPAMLGRLTKMSNEHFELFGKPLLDVDELISTAAATKRNTLDVWREKYKVDDRRREIDTKKQQDHDRQVADEAVRKYMSDHGQPFTRPAQPSLASHFTPNKVEDARHPWKGASTRKQERQKALLDSWGKPAAGSGAVA